MFKDQLYTKKNLKILKKSKNSHTTFRLNMKKKGLKDGLKEFDVNSLHD